MMITNDIYILYALLVSNAFLLGAAAIAVLRLQNLMCGSESVWNTPTDAAIQDSKRSSDQITEIVDQRFSSWQQIIDELSARDSAGYSQKSGDLLFDNAVRMAKHGANIDDLTRSCGLRRGEAELMMRIHAGKDKAPSSNTH